MPARMIHRSINVFRTDVRDDPTDLTKITRVDTHVQNKGDTYDNGLERHLRKKNPSVFFERGGKGLLEDHVRCGWLIYPGTRTMARRREEALSA